MDNNESIKVSPKKNIFEIILLSTALIIAAVAFWYLLTQKNTKNEAAEESQPVVVSDQLTENETGENSANVVDTTTAINNDSDLQEAADDLNSTDPDSMDSVIEQNNDDVSQF